jgi:hypothetical protein
MRLADWNGCLNLNGFSTEPYESFQGAGDVKGSNAESGAGILRVLTAISRIGRNLGAIPRRVGNRSALSSNQSMGRRREGGR